MCIVWIVASYWNAAILRLSHVKSNHEITARVLAFSEVRRDSTDVIPTRRFSYKITATVDYQHHLCNIHETTLTPLLIKNCFVSASVSKSKIFPNQARSEVGNVGLYALTKTERVEERILGMARRANLRANSVRSDVVFEGEGEGVEGEEGGKNIRWKAI